MLISWHPLLPGESPGDPELGGWRPIHRAIFRNKVTSRHIETPNLLASLQKLAQAITRRNLESAIQFVATMVATGNQGIV
jgi:hypothetical protein